MSLEDKEKKLTAEKNKKEIIKIKINSLEEQRNENKINQGQRRQKIKELEEKILGFEINESKMTNEGIVQKEIQEKEEEINTNKQKRVLLEEKFRNFEKQLGNGRRTYV